MEEQGSVEFTEADMVAIASIDLPALKPLLSKDQFTALMKFIHVNQATVMLNRMAEAEKQ